MKLASALVASGVTEVQAIVIASVAVVLAVLSGLLVVLVRQRQRNEADARE